MMKRLVAGVSHYKNLTFHDMYIATHNNSTKLDFSCTFLIKDKSLLCPKMEECRKVSNFALLFFFFAVY